MKKRNLFLLSILIITTFSLSAQTSIDATTTVDWENSLINISITAPLPANIDVLPQAKTNAENTVTSYLSIIIQMAMDYIPLNSSENVYDRLKKQLELTDHLQTFTKKEYKLQSYLTPDLQYLKTDYQIPLYPDFSEAFIQHTNVKPVKRKLAYTSSQKYTGIIIFVPSILPVHGEKTEAHLNPCLFPKILSSSGELVFTPEYIKPELLQSQGAVQYVDHLEKVSFELAGTNPLKIQATALYGANRTDIVIPDYLANQILYTAENRNLLSNARITIVCDPQTIISEIDFSN